MTAKMDRESVEKMVKGATKLASQALRKAEPSPFEADATSRIATVLINKALQPDGGELFDTLQLFAP